MSDSLRPYGLYSPWNSPGQNTEVGSLSLLQQLDLTQESNQGLLNCRQSLLTKFPTSLLLISILWRVCVFAVLRGIYDQE